MKTLKLCTFLFITVSISNCAEIKEELFTVEEVFFLFKELAYYLPRSAAFTIVLKNFVTPSNPETPAIVCKTCPQQPLRCDELLIKIQTTTIKFAYQETDITRVNAARKRMDTLYTDMTKLLLHSSSMRDIKKYMTDIACEHKIPCEGCQKVNWKEIEKIKS